MTDAIRASSLRARVSLRATYPAVHRSSRLSGRAGRHVGHGVRLALQQTGLHQSRDLAADRRRVQAQPLCLRAPARCRRGWRGPSRQLARDPVLGNGVLRVLQRAPHQQGELVLALACIRVGRILNAGPSSRCHVVRLPWLGPFGC